MVDRFDDGMDGWKGGWMYGGVDSMDEPSTVCKVGCLEAISPLFYDRYGKQKQREIPTTQILFLWTFLKYPASHRKCFPRIHRTSALIVHRRRPSDDELLEISDNDQRILLSMSKRRQGLYMSDIVL